MKKAREHIKKCIKAQKEKLPTVPSGKKLHEWQMFPTGHSLFAKERTLIKNIHTYLWGAQ